MMRMSLRGVSMRRALIVFLLFAVLSPPRDAGAQSRWMRLRSANFTFVGEARSARQIRRVAQQLEQFRETMLRAIPSSAQSSPASTVVIVFPDDRSFTPFKPVFQGKPIATSGLFVQGADTSYIAVNGDIGDAAVRTVFHGYAMFLIQNSLGITPLWVSQGLAQVYETLEERDGGKGALIGRATPEHLDLLRSRTLIPLGELMSVDRSSALYNAGNRRGLFYAQSWALMHYLTFGSEARRAQLMTYLKSLRGGATSEEAFSKSFQGDLATLEQELRQYVSRYAFLAATFEFDSSLRAVVAARNEDLSEEEAQGYLGDFLVRSGRTEDARAHLTKVIGAKPDAARALLALGRLEMRESRVNDALPRLERAATLMPDEAAPHAAYGYALVERLRTSAPGSDERTATIVKARSALTRSVELDPASAYAFAMLGYVELLSNEEPSRAVEALKRAVTLDPSDESYRLMLAEALTRHGDFEAATHDLGLLLAHGSRQDVRDRARTALGRVAQLRQRAAAGAAPPAARDPAAAAAPAPTPAAGSTTTTPPATAVPSSASPTSAPGTAATGGGRYTPVLREVGPGEQRVQGIFRGVVCSQGSIVLVVQTASETMRFSARRLDQVDFISYRSDTPGQVNCGEAQGSYSVLATYVPASRTGSASSIHGVIVAIELLPDGYIPK